MTSTCLKKATCEMERRDGARVMIFREVYDRGKDCCILLCDPARETVMLTRQFGLLELNGHPAPLIEICAGLSA